MPTASAIETTTPSGVYKFQLTMATRGIPQSQYNLAMMYETGSAVEKSTETARKWYIKSASQDYKPAIDRLIYLDLKTKGNRDKYIDWLVQIKKDADIGDAEATFLLGQMYAEGVGFEKDLIKAGFYLQKAVASDIAGSERSMAKVETEISMHKKQ
jgi:TPR repeat protein